MDCLRIRAIYALLRDDRHYKRSLYSSLAFALYVITFELGYLHHISTRKVNIEYMKETSQRVRILFEEQPYVYIYIYIYVYLTCSTRGINSWPLTKGDESGLLELSELLSKYTLN